MNERDRLERNTSRLGECFPVFAVQLRRVLDRMEGQRFRPRIQDGWRSIEDQLIAFQTGKSGLTFGFHNVTGPNGSREALACDVLDDDQPDNSRRTYLLALAMAAQAEGLDTGILWELSAGDVARVEAALAAGDIDAAVPIGFDPTHVQVTGLTVAQAHDGVRPTPAVPGPGAGDLPAAFTYIADGTEDWLWLGAERIHARCAVASVLDGLASARQVVSLGHQELGFHRFLRELSEKAGFSG